MRTLRVLGDLIAVGLAHAVAIESVFDGWVDVVLVQHEIGSGWGGCLCHTLILSSRYNFNN